MKKGLFWLILILFLGTALFVLGSFLIKPKIVEITSKNTQFSTSTQELVRPIILILAGDIMLDRGVKYMVEKYGNGDFKFPFLEISEEFREADIVFGNLEGPISDKGIKVGSIYSFRDDPKAVEGLNCAGFNILSLANNHAFDYGRQALEDTFLRLEEAGIDYVGAGFNATKTYSGIVKEVDGLKIGFLAYTNLGPENWKAGENNSGVAWVSENDFTKIKENIKSAKEKSDILIVSLHAGEEYQRIPTQFQVDFSKMAIGAGADLVVGHHPHVVEPSEIYNGKYIFYSLGNFIFDQSFSKETMESEIIKVLIENGKIKEAIPIKIKINQYFQPEIE